MHAHEESDEMPEPHLSFLLSKLHFPQDLLGLTVHQLHKCSKRCAVPSPSSPSSIARVDLVTNTTVMNRQWMYDGRRISEYITGLRNFLGVVEATKQNGFIYCSCVNCENTKDYLFPENPSRPPAWEGFMLHYYEDDDNYPDPMFSEYGDNATGEAEDQ